MRVLVLTPYLYGTTAGPRSSFELWEKVLEPEGIRLEYAEFESERLHEIVYEPGRRAEKAKEVVAGYARQLRRVLRDVPGYDAVLVNREAVLLGPALLERLAARKVPMIYQLDDPLYVPYTSPFNGPLSYLKFFGKVKTICRLSSVVIANSSFHVEFARRHNPNVVEVPSVVDADVFSPEIAAGHVAGRGGAVTVGWSGSPSTAPNLGLIERPLAGIAARDDVDVSLFGSGDADPLPGVETKRRPWSREAEVETIASFDVGLAPIPDSPWNRRKFFLKVVQYMALGVPPVATPIGDNPRVIDDGESGLLADGDAAWSSTLTALVEDRELRDRLGRRAAEVAHSRYTLQANAERIVGAFRSAGGR